MVSEATRNVMRANKSSGTKLELTAEEVLGGIGFILVSGEHGWRDVVGCSPDLVHLESGVVVFVHGCFWHGCPRHFKMPKTNVDFWADKVSKNKKRDARNAAGVRRAGWSALTFWEHDFKTVGGRLRVLDRAFLKIVQRSEEVGEHA